MTSQINDVIKLTRGALQTVSRFDEAGVISKRSERTGNRVRCTGRAVVTLRGGGG